MKLFKRIHCALHGHKYKRYKNIPKCKRYERKLVMKCSHCGKEILLPA